MATAKTRINISVSKDMRDVLRALAKRDELPVASKTADLIGLALELEEDRYFSTIADDRLQKSTRWLAHEEVWGTKKRTR